MVVKRLKAKALRDWAEDEHISSFATRLTREQEKLAAMSPPINISNEEKLQTYMENIWKRTDIFDEEFMTKWTSRTIGQRTWAHATAYFEAKVKAIEDFHAAGGQSNTYAAANAATEIKDAVAAALEEFTSQNKENAMAVNEVKEVREKIDTLHDAVALLAKTVAERTDREVLTPRKRNRSARRRRVVEYSSDEESSSSEEEDEQTPPRRTKRTARRTQRIKKEKTKSKKNFDIDGAYKPGMAFDVAWPQGKKAAYNAARRRYHRTGTKEAIKDKLDGMKRMLKVFKAKDVGEAKIKILEEAIERWEERRNNAE